MPFARAASPHFFQYVAELDSSPSIMVEPWEKKWTGVECILLTLCIIKLNADVYDRLQ